MHEKVKHLQREAGLGSVPQPVIKRTPGPAKPRAAAPPRFPASALDPALGIPPSQFSSLLPTVPVPPEPGQLRAGYNGPPLPLLPPRPAPKPGSNPPFTNFVDKKHQAVSKQAERNRVRGGAGRGAGRAAARAAGRGAGRSSVVQARAPAPTPTAPPAIPPELLFPVSEFPAVKQEPRPTTILSPPAQKFPRLSPDSGFPGSPELGRDLGLLEPGPQPGFPPPPDTAR